VTQATTPRRYRNRKGEGARLRQEILAAATQLLAESGDADALTIRAVAAACSVTPPAIYQHFADKQALLRALLQEQFSAFRTALQQSAAGASDACDALVRRCRGYVRFGAEHPGQYRVLFSARELGPANLRIAEGEPHPGAAAFFDLLAAVEACLVSRGRPGVSAGLVAIELWSFLHGFVDLRITKPEMPWPPSETLLDAVLAHLGLISASPATTREP
jgi:AcrR family transcriptional regulator